MEQKSQTIDKLLTPSWLSAVFAITVALVITAGVIASFNYKNSLVEKQLISWQNTKSTAPALTLPGETPPGTNVNSLQNTWPLLGFWMVIGLFVYFIVEGIFKSFAEAEEIKREYNYVNAKRDALVRVISLSIFIRLVAFIMLLFYVQAFFKRIIPYSLSAAHRSAVDLKSINSLEYALLAFVILIFSLHVLTLLIRLAAGRPRLFSDR